MEFLYCLPKKISVSWWPDPAVSLKPRFLKQFSTSFGKGEKGRRRFVKAETEFAEFRSRAISGHTKISYREQFIPDHSFPPFH